MSEQQQTTPSEAPTTAPATTPATASPALSLNVTAKPFVPKVSAKPFVPRSLAKPAATTAPTPAPAPVTTSAPAESESTTSEPAPEEPQKPVALADTREHLNIVFIGHVDAGKSTICGMLKNLTGQVDQRLLEKLQREAKEKNRETWVYAYLMDLCEEEREKGKTIEVSTARFETKNKRYTILDAPGHEYYVNNMISGASQADIAVLVISAKKNEFERGFDKGGQTREHATLAKTLGVKKLVCVVNKMDEPSVNWEHERYEEIVKKVSLFLKQSGYNLEKEVKFLPISGQSGINMTQKLDPAICSWYDGPCLTEVLDNLEPIERNVTGPLRIPIVDKFKDTKKGAVAVIGKIESGSISVGDRLLLMPTHREVECVNLRLHGNNDDEDTSVPSVRAGDNVQVSVKGLDEAEVGFGFVLCDIKHPPVPKVKEFIGQFAVVDKNMFAAGYSAVIHIHTAIEQFTITSLMKKLDKKTGKELPDKPKFGKTGDVITARFELEKPVCMEKFSVLPQLGRFTVREKGTVMVGKVTAIKPMN